MTSEKAVLEYWNTTMIRSNNENNQNFNEDEYLVNHFCP